MEGTLIVHRESVRRGEHRPGLAPVVSGAAQRQDVPCGTAHAPGRGCISDSREQAALVSKHAQT